MKDIQADQLIDAVRNAVRGQVILPARVAGKLASRMAALLAVEGGNVRAEDVRLSVRETDVATLMADGCSNREIARTLGLTEGTVKNYISTIYEKLGTNDRRQAVQLLAELLGPGARE